MADAPPARGLLGRLKSLLPGAQGAAGATPNARWPHRTARWLDPNVPLHGWRNRIDVADAAEALRVIAGLSEGRIDEAGVAEVLDAIAADREPSSFRFGARDAYRQLWIGAAPEEKGGVRLFLMSDLHHVERVQAALSVAGFHHAEKRAEYDRLGRFLIALWEWRGTAAASAAHLEGHDATVIAARLKRTVEDPQSPALELLRGLRLRTRDLVAELSGLDAAAARAADEWLASRGAPTLTELRGSVGSPE